ncbi:2-aminoethylphosphonate--pyruvate transaminase [Anabrus simplex]|uniref:2-aminoethylphosphonate--pyruvate transaminase n=1 Tax=Anabrus simplex TaxID=316456 RepID=UPI0035A3D320
MSRIIMSPSSDVDKKLFTPGPLGCSLSVKEAMLRDLGSRDAEFTDKVKQIRQQLLIIAGVSPDQFTSVLLQGSGTYCVESVLQTTTPRIDGRVLILSNGSYGNRMKKICEVSQIPHDVLPFPEDSVIDLEEVADWLEDHPDTYTTVSVVHCETSSGVINPVDKVGQLVRALQPGAAFFVDAMSSFGAVPIDLELCSVDYLVSSANKCLQGVPGFAFVIARKKHLLGCKGNARSLSLDIMDQYEGLEGNGQFRFTPPTHAVLAFHRALKELQFEGGVEARIKRYQKNCQVLQEGMKRMGFKKLLSDSCKGYIITSYHYPKHPNFTFDEFYRRLSDLGQLIYPGKVTNADCFRIGNIGDLYPSDMEHLLKCIHQVLSAMGVPVPVS